MAAARAAVRGIGKPAGTLAVVVETLIAEAGVADDNFVVVASVEVACTAAAAAAAAVVAGIAVAVALAAAVVAAAAVAVLDTDAVVAVAEFHLAVAPPWGFGQHNLRCLDYAAQMLSLLSQYRPSKQFVVLEVHLLQ